MTEPQKKSGVLHWFVIGCGVLTFIGLLGCGGCSYFGVQLIRTRIQCFEQAHETIRTSPVVVTALGEIRAINMGKDAMTNQADAQNLRIQVEGARAKGEVLGELEFKLPRFTLKSLTLVTEDGKRFPLK